MCCLLLYIISCFDFLYLVILCYTMFNFYRQACRSSIANHRYEIRLLVRNAPSVISVQLEHIPCETLEAFCSNPLKYILCTSGIYSGFINFSTLPFESVTSNVNRACYEATPSPSELTPATIMPKAKTHLLRVRVSAQ